MHISADMMRLNTVVAALEGGNISAGMPSFLFAAAFLADYAERGLQLTSFPAALVVKRVGAGPVSPSLPLPGMPRSLRYALGNQQTEKMSCRSRKTCDAQA